MNNRKISAFLLAGCSLLATVPALGAAEPPRKSHRSIGPWDAFDEDELNRRLQTAADMNLLHDLVDRIRKDPEQLARLNEKQKEKLRQWISNSDSQKKLLKDPDMQKLLLDNALRQDLDKIPAEEIDKLAKKIQEHTGDFDLNDKDREELLKTFRDKKIANPERLRELLSKLGAKANLKLENGDAIERLTSMSPAASPDSATTREGPEPMSGATTPAKTDNEGRDTPAEMPTPEEKPSTLASILLDMILEHTDLDDDFIDSVVDWLTNAASGDDSEGGWLKSAFGHTIDWVGSLHPGEWLPSDETRQTTSSWFGKLTPTSPPRETSGSSTPSSLPSASGFSSGSFSVDLEQLGRVVLWGLVLSIVAFAGWRLQLWYRGGDARGLPRRWPVRPEAVATRGDLVRAFEYLALLLVGVEAKHRHHLELAERLGGPADVPENARRQAANHLAHLYELARYAPVDEPLPETELAAARRDLSYLAGAGAA